MSSKVTASDGNPTLRTKHVRRFLSSQTVHLAPVKTTHLYNVHRMYTAELSTI